jgi:hypothetical protein
MGKEINEMFEKAIQGKLNIKALEKYEIKQEIKDLNELLELQNITTDKE